MAVAVISEFNPFHNGHKYLLEKAKKITGEPVITVMSGSFTQRGEVALCDKLFRAKTALKNGADLVVEMPAAYSVANAERFARAGVEIAGSFDCVNYLAFGCETDNIELLKKAAFAVKSTDVQVIVKETMKNGDYYPRAMESAVRAVMGDEIADVLSMPNNVLAVEYLRNLADCKIKPLPIKRIGAGHDSDIAKNNIASASFIRNIMRKYNDNYENADKYMPALPDEITYPENMERIILYKLRSMNVEDFADLPDVNEGLENRIFTAVNNYNSLEEIISFIKTKRYTHARIRRIMACALLGITEKLQRTPIEYVRVLGFTDKGAELLKHCSKSIVTSVSKGLVLGGNIKRLLERDIYSTDIAALAYELPKGKGVDFTSQPIKEPRIK